MPAILRRRKLISLKPENKNAITYRAEEVQAEIMTPPMPEQKAGKVSGDTVTCQAGGEQGRGRKKQIHLL